MRVVSKSGKRGPQPGTRYKTDSPERRKWRRQKAEQRQRRQEMEQFKIQYPGLEKTLQDQFPSLFGKKSRKKK